MTKKAKQIIDLSINLHKPHNKVSILAAAAYVSAKGTKHFYETLELLSEILPYSYKDEFERLRKTSQTQ